MGASEANIDTRLIIKVKIFQILPNITKLRTFTEMNRTQMESKHILASSHLYPQSNGIRLPLVLFVCFQLDCMTKCYWHSNNRALGQCMLEPYVWTRRHFVFEKSVNDCMP